MKIGIIGGGVVGRATARCYLEHCDEVRIWDMLPERRTVESILDAVHCDVVFICLPESELDMLFTHPLLIQKMELEANLVLKSTVPIGTTRRLREQYHLANLVHSPEFLTARCALIDAQMPARNIIGYPAPHPPSEPILHKLYEDRFPGIPIHIMPSDESEAVKLAVNSFFAVKVAFFNEVWTLCDALKLDWETVREGILSDGRICSSHTQVPGPDGNRGFGGACLPKDLEHFISHLVELKLIDPTARTVDSVSIAVAALDRNKRDRRES